MSYSQLGLEEDQKNSCRAIAHFLSKSRGDSCDLVKKRNLLLRDLCWRVSNLSGLERVGVMAESWYELLPDEIKNLFPPDTLGATDFGILEDLEKQQLDVGIVTVLPCEKDAVLQALDHKSPEREDFKSGGFRYFFGRIDRHGRNPLLVVVTAVGESGNIPCAIAVEHLLTKFEVHLLMVVGVAAGCPKKKVKLGDVVFAERVYDYEHVRLELLQLWGIPTLIQVKKLRPRYIEVNKEIKSAMTLFDENMMKRYFKDFVQKTDKDRLPQELQENFVPSLHKGTSAAGEKLFADGSLYRMYKRVDQNIRAGDQEDSGFAQVCDIKRKDWCIFRGVCDYGVPGKSDKWHLAAALAAAAASITFLKTY